ncbi:MAG: uracil phosphoribosyltransferase [Victivallales bacterium]|nr:uracil phosphoribosyltransferase [Victivallales bacterium]
MSNLYNPRLHIMDHPLIKHKISMLRRKETNTKDFRQLVSEIALMIGYEATRDLPLEEAEIETPLMKTTGYFLPKQVCLTPILRAGLGMVDAMLTLIPAARVGHIGLYRDPKTFKPVEYYCKLPPDVAERVVIVLDPMLATGGSASAAIGFLKKRGVRLIKLVNIIGAPEGVEVIFREHPDVDIYLGCLDQKLNDHAYILPGLGDAGDRLFGTL